MGGRRVRKTCFASPTEHHFHVNRRGIIGGSEWRHVKNVAEKEKSLVSNVMAPVDTDLIPTSPVSIAMVRKLSLVQIVAVVESLVDI